MGTPFQFLKGLFTPKSKALNTSKVRSIGSPADWTALTEAFQNYGAGSTTKAMRVSAVYACVDRKSKDMATLPLRPMRRTDSGSEIARDHDQYFIAKNPSPNWTKYQWQYTLNSHIELYGECFSPIKRKNGRPVEYGIWHPCDVEHKIVQGKLYWVNKKEKTVLSDEDMIHVMWFTEDGIRGKSVLTYAKDTIDLALNGSKLSSNLYANQMWSPGYISYKGDLTPEVAQMIGYNWKTNYSGEANKDEIPVLDKGSEWKHFGMSLRDSEYLGTIEHTVSDICRFYGVDPALIGVKDANVSYNSLEQQQIQYVLNTLTPRAVSWEQELDRKSISDEDQDDVYFKYEFKSRLRGDIAARSGFYDMGLRSGLFSINDVRKLEDMDTIGPEGDERYINGAQVPLSKLYSGELDEANTDKAFDRYIKSLEKNGNGTHKV